MVLNYCIQNTNILVKTLHLLGIIFITLLCPIGNNLMSQASFNVSLISQVEIDATSNDVWTFVDSIGREYVIAGNIENSQIFDITQPESPRLLATIPGARSLWRDFKSYQNYLYVVADQGNDGLTIIDMSHPQDSITYEKWTTNVTSNGESDAIQRCHNIYIDTIKGHAYLAGCNIGEGGVISLDLSSDPSNPRLIGIQDQEYAHDVIVQGDYMYTSEIFAGTLGIYDISSPRDPLFVNRAVTSTVFTHNAWPSDDGNYIFTTDERGGAFLDAYDISDKNQITRIDKYQPNSFNDVLPHNTHYHNGFLVTSWYIEGVIIIDAHRPHNLIRVGQYDTNPQNANGNWGVSPYLPSGNIVATDMDNGLFILKPDYVRASYLEGVVYDSLSRLPINGASIAIQGLDSREELTDPRGQYATGISLEGTFSVIINHPMYRSDTIQIEFERGKVVEQNFSLFPKSFVRLNGTVTDAQGDPVADAKIELISELSYSLTSDADGMFRGDLLNGIYAVSINKWGYLSERDTFVLTQPVELQFMLTEGYQDDFQVDLGWTVSGEPFAGEWTREAPLATLFNNTLSNPDQDSPNDLGSKAYITGNDDSTVAIDDVDAGPTVLTSPFIDLAIFNDPTIEFDHWFFNGSGDNMPNDQMICSILTPEDQIEVLAIEEDALWNQSSIRIKDWTNSTMIQLQFSVEDEEPGHLLEAGIDNFIILDDVSSAVNKSSIPSVELAPNPASRFVQLLNEGITPKSAELIDITGRRHKVFVDGSMLFFNPIMSGSYFLVIEDSSGKKYLNTVQIIHR